MKKLILRKDANWFICTISKDAPHNWDIAKQHLLWGIPTSGRKIDLNIAKNKDYLLFYMASKGFITFAELTDKLRVPIDKSEAPWAGGTYRYGAVMPFKILLELEKPLLIPFVENRIQLTNITATSLRKGFSRISSQDGSAVLSKMQEGN